MVDYDHAAIAPDAPERSGYTFNGWDTDFDSINDDTVITALYTINSYTVIFKDHDGQVLKI